MSWSLRKPRRDEQVAILIPAFQASEFIDRTLYLARGQTHRNIKIMVSVDASTDNTANRVARHAGSDSRITLTNHADRLGWIGNVNFLLEQVNSPYFFIYFHDDVILPQYTRTLLDALLNEPGAASAHCDMGHFGAPREISPGRPMRQPAVHRLLDFMLHPVRSSPLRSLIRADQGGELRLPEGALHGLWANEPFLLSLFACGPAVHIPETLYYRWNQREGGLTDGWRKLPKQDIVKGWQSVADQCIAVFEQVAVSELEMRQLVFALYLKTHSIFHGLRDEGGHKFFRDAGEFHPAFNDVDSMPDFSSYDELIAGRTKERWAKCRPQVHN